MPAWNPLLILLPRPLAFLGALGLWLGLGALNLTLAQAPYDDVTTAEGWAWSMIKQGKEADFKDHCGKQVLVPNEENVFHWLDVCREVSSQFLVDLLTQAPWRDAVPFEGIQITGARIVGDIDLANAKLIRPIEIVGSRIEGAINLIRARTDSLIVLAGSLMVGDFYADSLHSESDLFLRNGSVFKSDLFQRNGAVFKSDVRLNGARINGIVSMTGASFDGALDATSLQVGGTLFMKSVRQNKARVKGVLLVRAKIDGNIDMVGASFGTLNAASLHVGGNLFMQSDDQHKTTFKNVVLTGAKITGQVAMSGVSFDGTLIAEFLRAENDLVMRDANCTHEVDMVFAHVGGNLDLRGASLHGLDLSGASIMDDLLVGGTDKPGEPGKSVIWTGRSWEPGLTLRNAHVGNLMDAENAWPTRGQLHLDGFSFNHLGGFAGETGPEMRARGMDWWDSWARLDPGYSPAPYAQLAAALTSAGDRDAANEIRYLGRVRECEREKGLACVWCSALQYVAGFGIGTYTFRVLLWVLGFSLAGMALLLWTVSAADAGHRGPLWLWCFGASLARLLPGIEINNELTEFFNNPERTHLNWWQSVLFSALAMVGFVLGAILIAAVSGLTQSS